MSPTSNELEGTDVSFPRVSGDEPVSRAVDGIGTAFSPRERG